MIPSSFFYFTRQKCNNLGFIVPVTFNCALKMCMLGGKFQSIRFQAIVNAHYGCKNAVNFLEIKART